MTGKTHDLAAFSALNLAYIWHQPTTISLSTFLAVLCANFIGGLTPDIDQPAGNLWQRLPAGSLFGKLFAPFLGGHRHISHSILGLFLFGYGSRWLLERASHTILVDMNLVWWSFMIGLTSHLFMDLFTKEGVPLLFPLSFKFGIPPLSMLRVTTGKLVEKFLVLPALLLFDANLYYHHYRLFLSLFHSVF